MPQARDRRHEELEQQNTSQLLRIPYQRFIGQLFENLAAAGYADIHPSHAIVFQHVRAEGSRVTELAERTQLTKQYLGRLVAELEALGYLERATDPTDARAKLVRLSARGRELTEVAEATIAALEASWAQRVGPRRYAELRRRLIALIVTLESGPGQPIGQSRYPIHYADERGDRPPSRARAAHRAVLPAQP